MREAESPGFEATAQGFLDKELDILHRFALSGVCVCHSSQTSVTQAQERGAGRPSHLWGVDS